MAHTMPPAEDLNLRRLIENRAQDPDVRDRVFLRFENRTWTYAAFRDECTRIAHLLLQRLGPLSEDRPGRVAAYLDNRPEVATLLGGCGVSDLTFFAINTGLRGEPLADVLNKSRARVLVVDERHAARIDAIRPRLLHLAPENILFARSESQPVPDRADLWVCLDAEVGAPNHALAMPDRNPRPESSLCVLYTSGTTGPPKGVRNTHQKMLFAGFGVSFILKTTRDDVGYTAMPLFHSNSLFFGLLTAFWAEASVAIPRRFSASGFVSDIFEYGVTWWNYVGEPIHYILEAIRKEFAGDEERIRAEITENPRNKLRHAFGNGASAPDIDTFTRWFGLEDLFEHYGSTEAAIASIRKRGDPRGSVGELVDPAIQIHAEDGTVCAVGIVDDSGRLTNREAAVGEICKVADIGMFQGYFDDETATRAKYRDGVYHSGDLGHTIVEDGRRFLYFDGRMEDWIRKDGENFSGLQVSRLMVEHPGVEFAAAYGAPCAVADDLVMAALLPSPGTLLEPAELFHFCRKQIETGSMDEKWMPDFIRIVGEFEFTCTGKLVVRALKKAHFHPDRVQDTVLWRERGDTSYRKFTREDFERLRERFVAAERDHLL